MGGYLKPNTLPEVYWLISRFTTQLVERGTRGRASDYGFRGGGILEHVELGGFRINPKP